MTACAVKHWYINIIDIFLVTT